MYHFHMAESRAIEYNPTAMTVIPAQLLALTRWVDKAKQGDRQAMGEIYNRFKGKVFRIAFRYCGHSEDAQELMHDIFLQAFTHLHQLRKSSLFTPWFIRLAVNSALSHANRRKRERLCLQQQAAEENAPRQATPGLHRQLQDAIGRLPDKIRTVFILHDVEGFTHKEIAGIMQCTEGTSKSQLFKARKKLRLLLCLDKGGQT